MVARLRPFNAKLRRLPKQLVGRAKSDAVFSPLTIASGRQGVFYTYGAGANEVNGAYETFDTDPADTSGEVINHHVDAWGRSDRDLDFIRTGHAGPLYANTPSGYGFALASGINNSAAPTAGFVNDEDNALFFGIFKGDSTFTGNGCLFALGDESAFSRYWLIGVRRPSTTDHISIVIENEFMHFPGVEVDDTNFQAYIVSVTSSFELYHKSKGGAWVGPLPIDTESATHADGDYLSSIGGGGAGVDRICRFSNHRGNLDMVGQVGPQYWLDAAPTAKDIANAKSYADFLLKNKY